MSKARPIAFAAGVAIAVAVMAIRRCTTDSGLRDRPIVALIWAARSAPCDENAPFYGGCRTEPVLVDLPTDGLEGEREATHIAETPAARERASRATSVAGILDETTFDIEGVHARIRGVVVEIDPPGLIAIADAMSDPGDKAITCVVARVPPRLRVGAVVVAAGTIALNTPAAGWNLSECAITRVGRTQPSDRGRGSRRARSGRRASSRR